MHNSTKESAPPHPSAPPRQTQSQRHTPTQQPTFRGQTPFVEGLVVFLLKRQQRRAPHQFLKLWWGASKSLAPHPTHNSVAAPVYRLPDGQRNLQRALRTQTCMHTDSQGKGILLKIRRLPDMQLSKTMCKHSFKCVYNFSIINCASVTGSRVAAGSACDTHVCATVFKIPRQNEIFKIRNKLNFSCAIFIHKAEKFLITKYYINYVIYQWCIFGKNPQIKDL